MPNPNPSPTTRFAPLYDENMVVKRVFIRTDQAARLALEGKGKQNKIFRDALDLYFTVHLPPNDDTDHAAALDAMAAEPSEIDEE